MYGLYYIPRFIVALSFTNFVECVYGEYLGCFRMNNASIFQYHSPGLPLDDCAYQCRVNNKYFAIMRGDDCYCDDDESWAESGDVYDTDLPAQNCSGLRVWSVYLNCPMGQWGSGSCQLSCHCANNEPCISHSGRCTNGCKTGWTGATCNECAAGHGGTECWPCHCTGGAACTGDHADCRDGCEERWVGFPHQTCRDPACVSVGKFGPSCTEDCHCAEGLRCRQRDGHCYTGCHDEWMGSTCNYKSCDYNNGDCRANATCQSNSSMTWCVCEEGLRHDPQSGACVDEDECATGRHHCNSTERCVNSLGSYSCVCRQGFQRVGGGCTDIDECLDSKGNCSHMCENTVGSFKCSYPKNTPLTDAYNVTEPTSTSDGSTGGLVTGMVLLGACAIGLTIVLIRHRKGNAGKQDDVNGDVAMALIDKSKTDDISSARVHPFTGQEAQPSPNIYHNVTPEAYFENQSPEVNMTTAGTQFTANSSETISGPSVRLPVDQIEAHVTSLRTKHGFDEEYNSIPNEDRFPCDVGKLASLKEKNKFKNIHPYDRNRVLIPGKQDYINASYMDTYDKDDKHVAAQGPQKSTVDDFWTMIWQMNCSVVVMLTNPIENGKMKCEEYWPVEGSQMYGDLKVTCTSQHRRPDYTRRHLTVTQNGKEHRLTQLHFSTWPDHGVPSRPAPLLGMLYAARRAASARPAHTMLIHCSAGVGRTGTYLSIDQLLKMAAAEGAIDVPRCVNQLRDSRMKMVQTQNQYEFVYAAVQEGVALGDTQLAADQFTGPSLPAGLLQQAEIHYEYLEKTRPVFTETQLTVGLRSASLNRDPAIVAADRCRVILRPLDDYINAVHVCPGAAEGPIAAQVPIPGGEAIFWRLVHGLPGITVVSMEATDCLNQLCPQLIPVEGVAGHEGVRARRQGQHALWQEYTLTFPHTGTEDEAMYANSSGDGDQDGAVPPVSADARLLVPTDDVTAAVVVQAVQRVRTWTRNTSDSHVIVMCRDGASGCGQFVAASLLLDMLQTDRYVDVYSTVSALRHYRPQFVPSLEAYLQLYAIVQEYVRDYEIYQNV